MASPDRGGSRAIIKVWLTDQSATAALLPAPARAGEPARQDKGVRCWFAPEDMKIGAKIRDTIDEAIRLREKVLLVLSEAAINSDWVEDEVDKAFEEERQRGGVVLFPVRLDNVVMETKEAWAAKLRRSRNIGDFRAWKDHDAYRKALARVLRDLRIEASDGAGSSGTPS